MAVGGTHVGMELYFELDRDNDRPAIAAYGGVVPPSVLSVRTIRSSAFATSAVSLIKAKVWKVNFLIQEGLPLVHAVTLRR